MFNTKSPKEKEVISANDTHNNPVNYSGADLASAFARANSIFTPRKENNIEGHITPINHSPLSSK